MVEESKSSVLFIVSEAANVPALLARNKLAFSDHHDIVTSAEAYEQLQDKYTYDVLVVFWGPHVPAILNDQAKNSQKVKFVQALSAGIDPYMAAADFKSAANIPLTNVKGAYSHVLGEFIALGMLYHAKHVEKYMALKRDRTWGKGPVELCSQKTMAVVGFGDIGAACGRICKAFGTKLIGVKRRPDQTSEEHKSFCDELVGLDQLDRVYAEADFVVGVLPKTSETVGFFN